MSSRKKNHSQRSSATSLKKSSTKHSRKPTLQHQSPNLSSLLIYHFRLSKLKHEYCQLADKVEALVYKWPQREARYESEVLQMACGQQYCRQYYTLAKHQYLGGEGKRNIETALTEAIRKYESSEDRQIVLPHYGGEVYSIVKDYQRRIRLYNKKVQGHGQASIKSARKYPKELTTVISSKQQLNRKQQPKTHSLHSDSFELKMLSNCIKAMFEKQDTLRDKLGITRVHQNSWLRGMKGSNVRQPSMECDFSSIEMHSKVDLMLESRVKTVTAESEFSEPEELYGLTDLKKKYNDQKMTNANLTKSRKKALGHKRNPTDGIPLRKQYYFDALTPKQQGRWSVVGSSKQLPAALDRPQSKEKDSYCLTFKKQKKKVNTASKENRENGRSINKWSKSRSRQKTAQFKSPALKRKL